MTRKMARPIRLMCTHKKCSFTTGLFRAPVDLMATSGAYVVAERNSNLIVVHMLGSKQSFRVVATGSLSKDSFVGAEARWYMIDKSAIGKDSPLHGYSGFCFIGSSDAYIGVEHGFIPFGETEVMLDANGEKFLVWREK